MSKALTIRPQGGTIRDLHFLDRSRNTWYRTPSHQLNIKRTHPQRCRGMTIGIGVIATQVSRLDHLILLSDTQGSIGISQSMHQLPKMFCAPDQSLYAVGADGMEQAGEQFEVIYNAFQTGSNEYGQRVRQLKEAVDAYRRHRFVLDVAPRYAYKIGSLPESFVETNLTSRLLKEWKSFYIGCQLIIGFLDKAKCAALYYLDGTGTAQCFTMSGSVAIGSGADNSQFWLSYRDANISMPVRRAAYCAFEAKIMAENSPHVNDRLKMLIANHSEYRFMSDEGLSQGPMTPPVSLAELRRLFRKYGPRKLDKFA